MCKSILLSCLLTFLSLASISQKMPGTEKECRITSGIGFAGATTNAVSVGGYIWLQLDYTFSKNVSIASEFENMGYKLRGYYGELTADMNKQNCVDDNFSLLFKYHISTKSRLKISLGSGWSYTVRTSQYFVPESDSTSTHWTRYERSYDNYEIPVLLEFAYPLSKTLDVQARGKYDINAHDGDTYATGIGLSLKL